MSIMTLNAVPSKNLTLKGYRLTMKIQVIGIPSHAGALYEGTELAPQAIRDAGLLKALTQKGFTVTDLGDLLNGVDLPRHNIGPVRNWPAPRIVWDEIAQRAEDIFQEKVFTILLGGDCSIEVGTFHAFQKVFGTNSHLLVLDAHIDTMKPSGENCIGAAGMGLWFLLKDEKMWWKEDSVNSNCISIIGSQLNSETEEKLKITPFEKLNAESFLPIVQDHLNSITSDSIFVHLDVDVLHKSIMPAAYAPSEVGLDLQKATKILQIILADPRVKAIEITEFAANKDSNGSCAKQIVDLLSLLTINRN
jgi:arginase